MLLWLCHNENMTVEEYLRNIKPSQRAEYERFDKIVRSIVPDAEEVMSYGVLTWKYKGKYLLYFGAYDTHMSVYPIGHDIIEAAKDELSDFALTKATLKSKGTVQFSEDNPVPEAIIRTVVETRYHAISAQ